jgi:hypothetical protein
MIFGFYYIYILAELDLKVQLFFKLENFLKILKIILSYFSEFKKKMIMGSWDHVTCDHGIMGCHSWKKNSIKKSHLL